MKINLCWLAVPFEPVFSNRTNRATGTVFKYQLKFLFRTFFNFMNMKFSTYFSPVHEVDLMNNAFCHGAACSAAACTTGKYYCHSCKNNCGKKYFFHFKLIEVKKHCYKDNFCVINGEIELKLLLNVLF